MNIFEQMGILSIFGLMHIIGIGQEYKELHNTANVIKDDLKLLIENHKATYAPIFDNQIIEISLAILLLAHFAENDFLDEWIDNIIRHISFAYKTGGQLFPIQSDSIDDAIALSYHEIEDKEKLMRLSTLLANLLYWISLLDLKQSYSTLKYVMTNIFKKTSLQIWYPDEITDAHLYIANAGLYSGISVVNIKVEDNINDMREYILNETNLYLDKSEISSMDNHFYILPLISSRHFKTPILPAYFYTTIIRDIAELNSTSNENQT
jgi:hypothetical protein